MNPFLKAFFEKRSSLRLRALWAADPVSAGLREAQGLPQRALAPGTREHARLLRLHSGSTLLLPLNNFVLPLSAKAPKGTAAALPGPGHCPGLPAPEQAAGSWGNSLLAAGGGTGTLPLSEVTATSSHEPRERGARKTGPFQPPSRHLHDVPELTMPPTLSRRSQILDAPIPVMTP